MPGPPVSFGENLTDPCMYCVLSVLIPACIRYKDGEVIPVEEWDDVSVQMTKEDKSVISVLTINNLSHQRYDSCDIVEIRCCSYNHILPKNVADISGLAFTVADQMGFHSIMSHCMSLMVSSHSTA